MAYTPLSNTEHSDLRLTRGTFFYLQNAPCVPVSLVEAPQAGLDWPLAFSRREQGLQLVAILSLDETDNAAVGPKGLWLGGYIPAIVRAHPLAMRVRQGKGAVMLDTESDWLSTDQGNPLFDSEGNPQEVLARRIELLKNQAPNPNRDNPALQAIGQSGILEPWTQTLENLFRVSQQKLAALNDQAFLQLRQKNALPAVYAQLMSMQRINQVKNLAQQKQKMRDRMNVVWNQPVDDFSLSFDDEIISFDGLDDLDEE